MADLVWADVVAVAPEMATGVSTAFQTLILGFVNEAVDSRQFKGETSFRFTLARAYLAAHFGAVHKVGMLGIPASESEGGVSQSFRALSMPGDSDLAGTSYGGAYSSLVRRGPAMAGFVT